MKPISYYILFAAALCSLTASAQQENQTEPVYRLVIQENGPTLGYSPRSGIKLLRRDNKIFKDLNRNGKLDSYEDWRLPIDVRVADLVSQLSDDEIAGLMLYSKHQQIPSMSSGYSPSTYNGKPFEQSGQPAWALSDLQRKFLKEDKVRAVLVTKVKDAETAARWSNEMQAFVEGLDHGIPANNSSDPRHETQANAEYNYGSGGDISQWPTSLGLAATFSPELVHQFGHIAAQEYRALGITTALSPQVDVATEPRWSRFTGTFGEDPELVTDLAQAYVDGFQTSTGSDTISGAWGYGSVVAMVKHWPGGGPVESGRDSHFNYGKYAVYPGNQFATQLRPFLQGAFRLKDGTHTAGSVMTFYNVSWGQDPSGKNVGESFSHYIVTDLLRNKYHFDGVACTDWLVTADNAKIESFDGKCWGVENLSVAQRHYEVLKAGVDQFGGNNDKQPVLEAFKMGEKEMGHEAWQHRIRESARRLLLPMFRTGLFENPYLDPEHTKQIVGCKAFMEAGYQAQVKSLVMVKNHGNVLPVATKKKVYVPKRHFASVTDFFGNKTKDYWDTPIDLNIVRRYYEVVDDPSEADFAIVAIQSPVTGTGYSVEDREKGGNGYVPISLQYDDYTATDARKVSIAGGDPKENFTNRSYKGKTVKAANRDDMELVRKTRKQMGSKPVVLFVTASRPFVPAEIEPYADAIIVSFGTSYQPFFELVSGRSEPSGLLPCQLPKDMHTVETQLEDVPRDMTPYVDADGHVYDFAFGMNWNGQINDERVKTYK
ncbi:MAG: glycoside hydrolase family 3 N-terminal domain-containing protein [Prevotella sp.]|jgi:beta-glucosidase